MRGKKKVCVDCLARAEESPLESRILEGELLLEVCCDPEFARILEFHLSLLRRAAQQGGR